MKNQPNFHVIVLNWNGTDDTIACLKSIKESTYENFTIVLADNGSEKPVFGKLKEWCQANFQTIAFYSRNEAKEGGIPETEETLKQAKSRERLVFIDNNENLGFAAGNNVALRYTLASGTHLAMLLNNDTEIEKTALTQLVDFAENNPQFAAITPQIRYFEPRDTIWNCGGYLTWFGNRRYLYAGRKAFQIPNSGFKSITAITGCALLFRPHITGLLTEKFFFGTEDMEFSYRLRKMNMEMACVFEPIVYHKVSVSSKKIRRSHSGVLFLSYLQSFMNIRDYHSVNLARIKIGFNILYALLMMKTKYKIKLRVGFNLFSKVLKELKIKNNIDKSYTFQYLNTDFEQKGNPLN
jgi:GT2 family glycosyltransferase